jgi:DNA (cytosine-5)-methyltransferase 1
LKDLNPHLVRLERIARGELPQVLDLFADAGGLSLGFQRAGVRIVSTVGVDSLELRTHWLNVHAHDVETHVVARDVTHTEPDQPGLAAIEMLVGDPMSAK